jgi:hypothetical protein
VRYVHSLYKGFVNVSLKTAKRGASRNLPRAFGSGHIGNHPAWLWKAHTPATDVVVANEQVARAVHMDTQWKADARYALSARVNRPAFRGRARAGAIQVDGTRHGRLLHRHQLFAACLEQDTNEIRASA